MNGADFFSLAAGAFLLGIQTSISPCPLATNIAAVSYVSRRAANNGTTLFSGLLYTAGRTLAYVLLSLFLLFSARLSADQITRFFQTVFHSYLGPILILIGMVLTNLLSFPLPGVSVEKSKRWTDRMGVAGAFPLGIIFALAFCPTSAASFLAMLCLSSQTKSLTFFPFLYGIGTALPVLVFALIITFNTKLMGKTFQVTTHIDFWSRRITGTVLILIGVWFSLKYVYGI